VIRIVTLNCWKDEGDWPARMAAIAAGLAALQPDFVCLQEVYVGGGRDAGQWLAAATGLVCTHLDARHKLRGGVSSSSGVAVLSRVPAIGTMAIGLPTTLADGGRKALAADFATIAGPLRVASLHLSHLRGAESGALRAAQLSALVAAAEWDGPLVLAGDFNARWDAPELALLDAPGWVSSATMLAGHSSLIGQPDALIDHVVLRAGPAALALQQARIVLDQPDAAGVLPSDHAGVLAVLGPI
jgi:endonuclease/exonuclease/phosphatase family metal-dependent hydrolase